MKIRKFLKITVFSFTTILYSASAGAVSLEDSMITAYQNNSAFKAEQQDLLSKFEQLPQAYSGFLPTLSFNGDLRRKKLQSLSTNNQKLYSSDNTHQFSVNQPIFNGGQTLARVDRAQATVGAAKSDLQTVEEQALIQAISAHMDVVRDIQILTLSTNNERVLKEQLLSTNQRFQLGETTRTDVAQAESRNSSATSDRIRAQGQLIASIATYRSSLGLSADANVNPADFQIPSSNVPIPATMEESMNRAFDNNSLLAGQKFVQKASESDIRIAASNLLPELSLRGSISREKNSFDRGFDQNFNEDAVQLSLVVPFYQGGQEYSRVREAKKANERNKFLIDQRKDRLREDITKSWEDILTSRASIKSNSEAVRAANVALDGVKQEQTVGSRTIIDVLNAEQELFQTRVNLVNSQRNEVVSLYNLKFHMGELTAQNLGLPIQPFDVEGNLRKTQYKMIGF